MILNYLKNQLPILSFVALTGGLTNADSSLNSTRYSIGWGASWFVGAQLLYDFYYFSEQRGCHFLATHLCLETDLLHRLNRAFSSILHLPDPVKIIADTLPKQSFIGICHSQWPYIVKAALVTTLALFIMRKAIIAIAQLADSPIDAEAFKLKKPQLAPYPLVDKKRFALHISISMIFLVGGSLAATLLPRRVTQITGIQGILSYMLAI